MKKNELNNEIFESMLKHAIKEVSTEADNNLPSDEEYDSNYTPSPEFERKMQKLIKKDANHQRNKRVRNVMIKIAAGIGITLIISSATIMSVKAWRVKVIDYFSYKGEISTDIQIIDKNEEVEDNIDETVLLPSYIPEGYKLEQTHYLENLMITKFLNKNDSMIEIKQYTDKNSIEMDSEETEYINIDILGADGFYFETKGYTTLFFIYDEFGFSFFGEVSIDELVKMADSLE